MTIEIYLSTIGQIATGMVVTVILGFIVSIVTVYAFKFGRSLVKNADQNIEKFKNVKIFKEEKKKIMGGKK